MIRDDDGFFLVWKEGGGIPTVRHETEGQARAEAERLARNVGGRFYVLSAVAKYEKDIVKVTNLKQECPF